MSNFINKYPLSSCNCYKCTTNNYKFSDKGKPTNMSVRNCNFPNYFDCYDKKQFKEQIEPRNIKGYINLNPTCIDKLYDKTFEKIDCPNDKENPVYASTDPRLISSFHNGQILTLDRPAIDGSIKLDTVYTDPTLKYYGKKYNSYSDVNAGDIVYYIDRSIEDAFYEPVYSNNAFDTGTIFVDPMGSIKPQYNRKPVYNDNVLNTKKDNFRGGLSWIQDSNEQREDLIALQQRTHNQSKYSSRWTGNISA